MRLSCMPKRAREAHARKCGRQEKAIGPTAESTPEFWKIESLEPGRSPAADEMHDCSCRRRSSSQRSCARHDSRPGGRAGAIAGTHSARAPKETRRKRMPREERSRNYLNALTSLRSELVAWMRLAQAIFCKGQHAAQFRVERTNALAVRM